MVFAVLPIRWIPPSWKPTSVTDLLFDPFFLCLFGFKTPYTGTSWYIGLSSFFVSGKLTCTWECPSFLDLQGTLLCFGCRALISSFTFFLFTPPTSELGKSRVFCFLPYLIRSISKTLYIFTLTSKFHTRGATHSKKRTNRFPYLRLMRFIC